MSHPAVWYWQDISKKEFITQSQRRKTETKPDIYSKDRIFVTSFAFCVITYEPIEIQTFSAPQNHHQNLGFVKDIKVVVEKMTRNRRKVIRKPGDSLLCRLHSIQLSSLRILFSMIKSVKITASCLWTWFADIRLRFQQTKHLQCIYEFLTY